MLFETVSIAGRELHLRVNSELYLAHTFECYTPRSTLHFGALHTPEAVG